MNSDIIYKYFDNLTQAQKNKFEQLKDLYCSWNEKINIISRKDIDHLYEKHILHSLAIAKIVSFIPNAKILDVGTGGGFPSIPLAILFPETHFTAIDSIAKKIKVVESISQSIALNNITAKQERAENIKNKFDFVVCRAVTNLPDYVAWVKKKVEFGGKHALPNGIICLKGGDLREEIAETLTKHSLKPSQIIEYQISDFFEETFFETKKILYIQP